MPFLLAIDAFLRWSQNFKRHLAIVEKLSGVLFILAGSLILLGSFSVVAAWLINWFPLRADIEAALVP